MGFYKYEKQYRYKNYDYSDAGYYFITICTKNFKIFFGDVINDKVKLSIIGEIAKRFWREIPSHFNNIELDEYIIMPNHIHGIIIINENENDSRNALIKENVGTGHCPVPNPARTGHCPVPNPARTGHCPVPTKSKFGKVLPNSLSTIIGSFKSAVTKNINLNHFNFSFAWQPRFYDHIIRNEKSLMNIREYIINNPLKWSCDRNYFFKEGQEIKEIINK